MTTQTFRCRVILPEPVERWTEVQAETLEDAVQDYHLTLPGSFSCNLVLYPDEHPTISEITHYLFARIEVEGHESVVSKLFHHGITRRGGVRRRRLGDPRQAVADALKWTGTLDELTDSWDGEETMDQAAERDSRRLRGTP